MCPRSWPSKPPDELALLLAISTATEALSLALFEDGALLAESHEMIGRGHAEALLPEIAALLGERRPGRIVVDCGPGSFTGVRVGIAAAKGLAIAWRIPVAGVSSTVLIAAGAGPDGEIGVAIKGGHGEVFLEMFAPGFHSISPVRSVPPAEAARLASGRTLIGSGAASVSPGSREAWPCAAHLLRLPEALRTLPARALYARRPDALTLAEQRRP